MHRKVGRLPPSSAIRSDMAGTLPIPLRTPPKREVLWRFMSLAKFLAMLQRQALYLTRVDQLLAIDPFEGSVPRRYEAARIAAKRFKPVVHHALRVSPEAVLAAAELRAEMHRKERSHTFVSCWYSGRHDSDAMWRLSGKDSVAVRTTVARLSSALPEWAYIGRVTYKDYETQVFPTSTCWSPFFHKRECFAHEREVRVLVNPSIDDIGRADALKELGIEIPMNMRQVLTAIHVSPASPKWFLDVVNREVALHGLTCPVQRAMMDREPAF